MRPEVAGRMERTSSFGRTLTLKVKYADFTQITRSRTVPYLINGLTPMTTIAGQLTEKSRLDQASPAAGPDRIEPPPGGPGG